MAKVIGSVNQKGGQGKSQGAHAIAMVLADVFDKKVLVIDFDPQGAQSILFGIDNNFLDDNPMCNVALLFQNQMNEIVPFSVTEKIDAILANYSLNEFSSRVIRNKENLLRKLVDRFRGDYDYIIIDAEPTIGDLMTSVVLASDNLFVPIKTNLLDERGTIGFIEEFFTIIESYDKEIEKITLTPNMYESAVNDNKESLFNIKNNFPEFISRGYRGELVVTKPIPKRSLFGAAASDKDINNVLKFIEEKSRANMDIALLLKEITIEAVGGIK